MTATRSMWAPIRANDQTPSNQGALSRIEGWPTEKPFNNPIRFGDLSALSYLTLKRIESWDTVRSHITR